MNYFIEQTFFFWKIFTRNESAVVVVWMCHLFIDTVRHWIFQCQLFIGTLSENGLLTVSSPLRHCITHSNSGHLTCVLIEYHFTDWFRQFLDTRGVIWGVLGGGGGNCPPSSLKLPPPPQSLNLPPTSPKPQEVTAAGFPLFLLKFKCVITFSYILHFFFFFFFL